MNKKTFSLLIINSCKSEFLFPVTGFYTYFLPIPLKKIYNYFPEDQVIFTLGMFPWHFWFPCNPWKSDIPQVIITWTIIIIPIIILKICVRWSKHVKIWDYCLGWRSESILSPLNVTHLYIFILGLYNSKCLPLVLFYEMSRFSPFVYNCFRPIY